MRQGKHFMVVSQKINIQYSQTIYNYVGTHTHIIKFPSASVLCTAERGSASLPSLHIVYHEFR